MPEIRFQRLELDGNLGGNFYSDTNRRSSAGQFDVGLNYSRRVNVDALQSNHFGFLNIDGESWRDEFPDAVESKSQDFSSRLYLQSLNRFYTGRRSGFFIGLHGAISGTYRSSDSRDEAADTLRWSSNAKNYHAQPALRLTVGSGRIEPVTTARIAYDTYRSLLKYKRLNQPASNEQITALADEMVEVINTRFFDPRFKTIFQLEQIDSVLQSTGLITQDDIVYFAQVNDIWLFQDPFFRGSGSRWEVGLAGQLSYSEFRRKSEQPPSAEFTSTTMRRSQELYLTVDYTYQLPKNIYWQHDFFATFTSGFEWNQFEQPLDTPDFRNLLGFSYDLGWFPNTRTRIWGTANADLQFDDSVEGELKLPYALGTGIFAELWLTPRFQLFANARIRYSGAGFGSAGNAVFLEPRINSRFSGQLSREGFDAFVSAGFSYAIF